MGEAKRRKQLLGETYGQAKSGKINVYGEEVGLTYLTPGSEDWSLSEEVKTILSKRYNPILIKNVRLDFVDGSNLVGAVMFRTVDHEICVGSGWYRNGKRFENKISLTPSPVVKQLIKDCYQEFQDRLRTKSN